MTSDLQNPGSNTYFNSVTEQRKLKTREAKEYEEIKKGKSRRRKREDKNCFILQLK